jgi:ribosome-associated protein
VAEQIEIKPGLSIPEGELTLAFSRSGGKGGQNVNKVSTRVELRFDVGASPSLRESQRMRIQEKLANRIDKDGILHLVADGERSQWANREAVTERFRLLLAEALHIERKRKATRPSRGAQERRIQEKKAHASKKSARNWKPD